LLTNKLAEIMRKSKDSKMLSKKVRIRLLISLQDKK